jgi:glycerol-3-phosphate O-acyltransferase
MIQFLEELQCSVDEGRISSDIYITIRAFYESYCEALRKQGRNLDDHLPMLSTFLEHVERQIKDPYNFPPCHEQIIFPFDYYHFGLEFLRPVIRYKDSHVSGLKHVDTMVDQLKSGDNVILFANHQTEPDPQAISLLLDRTHPRFAMDMYFVAGHRVTTDPLAVPFSLGRNLVCIYSKKYIETEPEKKQEKLIHNQRTMQMMGSLLADGGKCIYVAPSGGRDRPNEKGIVEVAPFDPQSIEMFRLIAEKSGRPAHFYPLSLSTYTLLPPPNTTNLEVGEARHTKCTPIHLAFGEEIDMMNFPGSDSSDKNELRIRRAEFIWGLVNANYQRLPKE